MAFDYLNYDELLCIISDGTQIIDTGISIQSYGTGTNTNFEIIADMQYNSSTITDSTLFCLSSHHSNGAASFGIGSSLNHSDFTYLNSSNSSYSVSDSGLTYDTNRHIFLMKRFSSSTTDAGFYIDDDYFRNSNIRVSTNYKNVAIFGRFWGVNAYNPTLLSNATLYSLGISNNTETVATFIPAKRKSDNVVGVYDTIREEFITSTVGNPFNYIPLTQPSNIYIKDSGTWKKGIPFIKNNGEWKQGVPYIKTNGTWKKGG